MFPTSAPITLFQAFPALAPAVDPALHALPLASVRRLKAWPAIVQTFALSAARRRDLPLGDLTGFPADWAQGDLAGEWNPPPQCRGPAPRTLRILARAGLRHWRDVLDRTPAQLLETTGAGLITLSDVLACAIELSAAWSTGFAERPAACAFGVSRNNYPRRAVRG